MEYLTYITAQPFALGKSKLENCKSKQNIKHTNTQDMSRAIKTMQDSRIKKEMAGLATRQNIAAQQEKTTSQIRRQMEKMDKIVEENLNMSKIE